MHPARQKQFKRSIGRPSGNGPVRAAAEKEALIGGWKFTKAGEGVRNTSMKEPIQRVLLSPITPPTPLHGLCATVSEEMGYHKDCEGVCEEPVLI